MVTTVGLGRFAAVFTTKFAYWDILIFRVHPVQLVRNICEQPPFLPFQLGQADAVSVAHCVIGASLPNTTFTRSLQV